MQQPDDDHFLYKWLIGFLEPLHLWPGVYSLFAFLLLYSQALLLNRVCNAQKMMARPNYLVAMSYMLITSLLPEWNYFSAPLLINSLLIWLFYRLNTLYNAAKPGAVVFNAGLIMGFITLLYQPAIVFVFFLMLAVFIVRPFRIKGMADRIAGCNSALLFYRTVIVPHRSMGLEKNTT